MLEQRQVPNEARQARIELAGEALVATPAGLLFWPDESLLIVADLHLEKGSAFARRGSLLPPYDTMATLAALAQEIALHAPRRVIALGDSFHDDEAVVRLAPVAKSMLLGMMRGREWIWIAGNHDPSPIDGLGGESQRQLCVGRLSFRHEPTLGPASGEIAGHLHPAARVRLRGRSIRRRCFATDANRIVMPAFGAYAGGLNVLNSAFRPLFPPGAMNAFMLGESCLHAVSRTHLVDD